MSAQRYRILINVSGQELTREVMLDSTQPIAGILNWLDDEYDYRASLRKAYWLRDDGFEEQIR